MSKTVERRDEEAEGGGQGQAADDGDRELPPRSPAGSASSGNLAL